MSLLNTFRVFFLGNLLFAVGFSWLAFGGGLNSPAGRALQVVAITLVLSAMAYAATGVALRRIATPSAVVQTSGAVLGVAVAVVVAATLAFWLYTPTSALTELFRTAMDPAYKSAFSDIEIRLASSLAPKWVQIFYEAARRFLIPVLLIQFYVVGDARRMGVVANIALIASALFAVFYTLDRFIPALYACFILLGTFYSRGWRGLRSGLMYASLAGALLCVVGFRSIQYGHFAELQTVANPEIATVFESDGEAMPVEKTAGTAGAGVDAKPASNAAAQAAAGDAPTAAKPDEPAQPVDPASATANPPGKPALAEPAPGTPSGQAAPVDTTAPGDSVVNSGLDIARYAALVLVERVVLSPLAMSLYATENYHDGNFRHWNSTRLFSLLGIGRYVDPLESGSLKHHDAFPVSYVGDLWRNGGLSYVWIYAALIGVVLALLDDLLFRRTSWAALRAVSVMGAAVLFYGNAFNATSILFFSGGAVMGLLLLAGIGAVSAPEPLKERPSP